MKSPGVGNQCINSFKHELANQSVGGQTGPWPAGLYAPSKETVSPALRVAGAHLSYGPGVR